MSTASESETPPTLITCLSNRKEVRKRKLHDPLHPYLHAAIDPFADLVTVLKVGMAFEYGVNLESNLKELGDDVSQYYRQLFQMFVKLVPDFGTIISELERKPEETSTFFSRLGSAAGNARSEDCGSLKHTGITYIPPNPEVDTVQPPICKEHSKSMRGFNHIVTARLLCPMRYLNQFDDDDEMAGLMQEGRVKIGTGDWPAYLYDENQEYDPEEKDKGLFRGYVLVRVYRHIFTGPATAFIGSGRKGTKASKSKLHGLSSVTPRTIAYAAVQTRFFISSLNHWSKLDGEFNMQKFFNNIVKLFESNPDDPWCTDTLAWWNNQVPELSEWSISLQKNTRYSDPEDDEYELNEILSKRAARSQRSNAAPNPRGGVPNLSGEGNDKVAETPKSGDTASRASSLTPSVQSVDLADKTGATNEGQTRIDSGNNRGGAKKRGRGMGGRGRVKGARGRGKVTQ